MNLILKIVQGPNAGAEIALIEGINVKLGKDDACDIVIADQSLPDVACEIEVGAERVTLLLPGGAQERLEPLHAKSFGTTAIAVGPAEGTWGALIWPKPEPEKQKEQPEKQEEQPVEQPPKSRKLQITLLVVLLLIVALEFLLWFFWPYCNGKVAKLRKMVAAWSKHGSVIAIQPIFNGTLEDLAKTYGVELITPKDGNGEPLLKGNLKTSAERLKLTAEAYSVKPGINLELSDDESLKRAAEEILLMTTGSALSVEKVENRQLTITGSLKEMSQLEHVLKAIQDDIPLIEKTDCSQVAIIASAKPRPQAVVAENPAPAVQQAAPAKTAAVGRLPVVGVMTTPFPYLVLSNGSRVIEGAEFGGYMISKISEDVILLTKDDETIEWRP